MIEKVGLLVDQLGRGVVFDTQVQLIRVKDHSSFSLPTKCLISCLILRHRTVTDQCGTQRRSVLGCNFL